MVEEEFFYKVENYIPGSNQMNSYSFHIKLSKEFARKAFETVPETTESLQEQGKRIIKRVMGLDYRRPYHFFRRSGEETGLVQFCRVPGNATQISMGPIDDLEWELDRDTRHKNYLTYNPHNIDNHQQAYTLLSLWSNWANTIPILFDD